MKNLLVYLKTTETCNLNCRHCFTNGINGAKVFWDVPLTIDWIKRMHQHDPDLEHIHFEFHGGEPFLVDIADFKKVYNECNGLWGNQTWGATSNLTFKLYPDQIDFIENELGNRIGTSWDPDIRFANPKQYDLWRKNVETLVNRGVTVKLFISLTKGTVDMDPSELIEWVRDLGVKEMSIERLTMNGSATQNLDIFPSNIEQDRWFLEFHRASERLGARDWFENEILENIYAKFETGFIGGGTFCRDCEQKLFTINADGTIAGCPNSAPEAYYGKITDSITDLLTNPKRMEIIACETHRDPRCYNCPVFQYCGGDCHQLEWQGDVCAAPKSLMLDLAGINTNSKLNKVWTIKEIE